MARTTLLALRVVRLCRVSVTYLVRLRRMASFSRLGVSVRPSFGPHLFVPSPSNRDGSVHFRTANKGTGQCGCALTAAD